MRYLKNKTIFLLSPQAWGNMHVSKHHYAIELVNHGNTVYFFNPPNFTFYGIKVEEISQYAGLKVVTYSPFFSLQIRFHARWLFDILMKLQVTSILKSLQVKPDVVWCFDPNIFSNLNWFNAKVKIFHPVDPITRQDQVKVAFSANILFSVSQKILNSFLDIPIPKYFINHGLGKEFEEQALLHLSKFNDLVSSDLKLKVGYVGNLLRKPIDRPLFLKIIKKNPDMVFHLWGPYELEQSNLSGNQDLDTLSFISTLKTFPNVVFRGVKKPAQLAEEIHDMDLFFLTYQWMPNESDRSNAHKLIEYLSTGKPIITIDIETYRSLGLMEMASETNDTMLIDLFYKVKTNYPEYYNMVLRKKRIEYALNNTMKKQVSRIDELLSSEGTHDSF